MSLYSIWRDTAFEHANETLEAEFWKSYCEKEKEIYESILEKKGAEIEGIVKELAKSHNFSNELFMGFLDGINDSLVSPLDLEEITEESEIKLEIDFEKLYYNMLEAQADYLYTLPQWDEILEDEKRKEITKAQKISKTVVKEEKISRNEPCPCGSGKKYKKCCGK